MSSLRPSVRPPLRSVMCMGRAPAATDRGRAGTRRAHRGLPSRAVRLAQEAAGLQAERNGMWR
eukprot:1822674-Prymnesium_polylepis.1